MDFCLNAITVNCSQYEEDEIDGDLYSDGEQEENQMSWRRLFYEKE
jgi:hypothetical protein